MKNKDSVASRSQEEISYDIDFDDMLNKYGPEGLYDIAKKLIETADKDISDSYYDRLRVTEN